MRIETKQLSELKPADWNPRKISDKALAGLKTSIEKFGLVEPIIYNSRSGNIVGGHQRLKVLNDMGEKETEVIIVDLPENEEKALNITLNNPNITGEFTDDLQIVLEEIKIDLGDEFEELKLDDLYVEPLIEGKTDPDEVPDVPEEPIAKRGDIWMLGNHRVMCGDSTNAEDVGLLMDGTKADMMWTDPPYGVNYTGKTKDSLKIQGDNLNFAEIIEKAFKIISQNAIGGMPFYCAHPAGEHSVAFGEIVLGLGWHFHETLVWVKNTMVMGHSDYHLKHESMIYGWIGKNRKWYSGRSEVSIFEVNRPSRSESHPTMKPVDLIIPMINNSTRNGNIVIDPFLGSGSTLIACEQTNRRCFGIEIEPKFCDVIIKRWEDFTEQNAELIKM